jgi:hypothetical protein
MSEFKNWVAVGIYYLGCGVHDYATWSTLMVADVGPEVEAHLRHVWKWSHATATPPERAKKKVQRPNPCLRAY